MRVVGIRALAMGAGSLAAVLPLALFLPGQVAAAGQPKSEFPTGTVTLAGHGYGPGIGMGQWGAFGYAAVEHKSYKWILSHFYGGTTLTSLPAGPSPSFTVAITENAGEPVTVTSTSAFSFGGVSIAAGKAARATIDPATGTFSLSTAASCNAKTSAFTPVANATSLTDPLAVPTSSAPSAPSSDLLTLCEPGGVKETLRGSIEAYDYDTAATENKALARTVNVLSLEEYVADVVPAESSSGWGGVGGAGPQDEQWGFQELEAQAVAARSYALAYEAAGGWSGYADICDSDDCQSYPGIADESPLSNEATSDTAGSYLLEGGQPVAAEYSASTGGWTVNSTFPAVSDAGDSVCMTNTDAWTCNPEHDWTASFTVRKIEALYPSVGTLQEILATSRNGLGAWGGRVLTVKITGSKGSLTTTGDDFASALGLYSNWFHVVRQSAPGPPSTTTTTTTLPPAPVPHPSVDGPWPILRLRGTGPVPKAAPGGRVGRASLQLTA